MNGERKQKDSRLFGGAAIFGSKMYLLALFGLLVLSLLWFAPQKAFTLAAAGNGPGGVGVTDGSSTLELWLRADRGVFSDSGCATAANSTDNVGCWKDQSGSVANATQGIPANQPVFTTGSINGQPVLTFAGNQVLNSGSVTLSSLTVFAVFNASDSPPYGGMVYEHNNRSTGGTPGSNLVTSDTCTMTVNRSGSETTKNFAPNWAEDGDTRIVTQAYDGTHTGHTLSINNAPQTLTDCNPSPDPGIAILSAGAYIGAQAGNNCCGLNGDIAELIFFNENLPDVQKILVENYLSAKYNITLASNDYYDGDTPPNGDFDLDVAGIGRFGGVSHTEAQAAGMVVVNGTFLVDNGDWLLFGHNVVTNGNVTTLLPTASPWNTAPNPARWSRSWYVDVTDYPTTSGGTVNITFDFNQGGMGNFTPSSTASDYRLLKWSSLDGSYSDLAGATSVDVGNKRVTFTGINVADLGSDFTLGTLNNNNSPTAVSLQPIVATPQTNGLLIFAACVLALGFGSLWACLRHRPE